MHSAVGRPLDYMQHLRSALHAFLFLPQAHMRPTGMQSYLRASVRSGAALLGYSCPHRTMAACRCAGQACSTAALLRCSRPHRATWQVRRAFHSIRLHSCC